MDYGFEAWKAFPLRNTSCKFCNFEVISYSGQKDQLASCLPISAVDNTFSLECDFDIHYACKLAVRSSMPARNSKAICMSGANVWRTTMHILNRSKYFQILASLLRLYYLLLLPPLLVLLILIKPVGNMVGPTLHKLTRTNFVWYNKRPRLTIKCYLSNSKFYHRMVG